MHTGPVYWVTNIVISLMWMICANIVLDSRYSKIRTIITEFLIQIIFWYITENYLIIFSSFRFMIAVILLAAIHQYFHTDSRMFILITTVTMFLAMVMSEILLGTMLSYESIQSGEIFRTNGVAVYSVYLFFNMTFLAFFTAVLRSIKHRFLGLLVEKEWLLFSIFPFSQCFSIWGWFSSYNSFSTLGQMNVIIPMILVFLLADVALIYMIRISASRAELQLRSSMLEEQIRSQGNYYDQLASTYSDIRRMRHDIDKHLYTIRALLDHDKTEDAIEYADQIIKEDEIHVHFSDCRNTVVANYLEKKLEDLNAAGITLETDIHLPVLETLSDPDLICIYGNILDNAAEACSGMEHPVIKLSTVFRSPYLTISCANPINSDTPARKQRIPALERGVGLTILSHLAEKYDGQFTAEQQGQTFLSEIILKA